MPGRNLYGIANQDNVNSYKVGGRPEEYDEKGENPDYEWNAEKDCGRVWKRTGDYYPSVGNIYPTEGNTHNYAGGWAYYWTAHEYTRDSLRVLSAWISTATEPHILPVRRISATRYVA